MIKRRIARWLLLYRIRLTQKQLAKFNAKVQFLRAEILRIEMMNNPNSRQRAVRWAADRPWFGVDEEKTGRVMQKHYTLCDAGITPDTEEYWGEFE